jgi:hypothetical protein
VPTSLNMELELARARQPSHRLRRLYARPDRKTGGQVHLGLADSGVVLAHCGHCILVNLLQNIPYAVMIGDDSRSFDALFSNVGSGARLIIPFAISQAHSRLGRTGIDETREMGAKSRR